MATNAHSQPQCNDNPQSNAVSRVLTWVSRLLTPATSFSHGHERQDEKAVGKGSAPYSRLICDMYARSQQGCFSFLRSQHERSDFAPPLRSRTYCVCHGGRRLEGPAWRKPQILRKKLHFELCLNSFKYFRTKLHRCSHQLVRVRGMLAQCQCPVPTATAAVSMLEFANTVKAISSYSDQHTQNFQ